MALTVFPTIKLNTGTGSDTAASGAGPGTAIAAGGNNGASTNNTTTVDLSADTPDLSGVAQDGSAVLWVDSSSGRQFSRIDTVDDGADTVTCEDTFTQTEANRNWGIGGKRNDLGATSNRLLGTADAKAGWTIELEDDQSISAVLVLSVSGTTTNYITFRGASGAIRKLTQTASANVINVARFWHFENFKVECSNVTPAFGISTSTSTLYIKGCEIGDATNQLQVGIERVTNLLNLVMIDTEVHHCTGIGINMPSAGSDGQLELDKCSIYDNGGDGVTFTDGPLFTIRDTLIYDNGGAGVDANTSVLRLTGNTIHGNTGDGVNIAVASRLVLYNNEITGNGGWGIKGPADVSNIAFVDYNNFGTGATANTSGDSDTIPVGANSLNVDPGYANAGSGDFAVGTNVKAEGFPDAAGGIGISKTTTSYVDIGAAQREEAGGGALSFVQTRRNTLIGR